MQILVSNDDGILASGLRALLESLRGLGEIFVVAPDRERSAIGHSITMHRPLRVKKVNLDNLCVQSWAVDGTPSDCVKLAVEDLLPKPPDLVVSGINQGPNLGTDVLYSGTVSAAVEGAINGIPALAVSLASYTYDDFSMAGTFVRQLISRLTTEGLLPGMLLNINIPAGQPRGVKITRLGNRRYINIFDKRTDPRGRLYYWMAGEPQELEENTNNTDVGAVNNHYISITPLHIDLTDYQAIERLRQWF